MIFILFDLVADILRKLLKNLEDIATRQVRARLWRNGELLQEEVHTQKVEDYSKHELILMLERAGFGNITITGDYRDEQATADHNTLIFIWPKRSRQSILYRSMGMMMPVADC